MSHRITVKVGNKRRYFNDRLRRMARRVRGILKCRLSKPGRSFDVTWWSDISARSAGVLRHDQCRGFLALVSPGNCRHPLLDKGWGWLVKHGSGLSLDVSSSLYQSSSRTTPKLPKYPPPLYALTLKDGGKRKKVGKAQITVSAGPQLRGSDKDRVWGHVSTQIWISEASQRDKQNKGST